MLGGTPKKPAKPEKKSNPSKPDTGATGVNAIRDLTGQTIGTGGAPENQRIAALVVGVAGIVVLVIGLALIPAGRPDLTFWAVAGAFVLMAIALIVALKAGSPTSLLPLLPPPPSDGAIRGKWSRVVPKLEINLDDLNRLGAQLRTIRELAKAEVGKMIQAKKSEQAFDPDHVRANVFLADTRDVQYGEVCGLFIPRELHVGMTNEAERGLRFRTNQGLTGRVFTQERAFGACCRIDEQDKPIWSLVELEGPSGGGVHQFQMTLEQLRLIDSNLRWIVSFPLKSRMDGQPGRTMGVLNVDGLHTELDHREMRELANVLGHPVEEFAAALDELDKSRITIIVEDVPGTKA